MSHLGGVPVPVEQRVISLVTEQRVLIVKPADTLRSFTDVRSQRLARDHRVAGSIWRLRMVSGLWPFRMEMALRKGTRLQEEKDVARETLNFNDL